MQFCDFIANISRLEQDTVENNCIRSVPSNSRNAYWSQVIFYCLNTHLEYVSK